MARFQMVAAAILVLGAPASAQDPGQDSGLYIAGLRPFERPADAPVITRFEQDAAWYERALTGVLPPYPASLKFLEDQGPWYTPFNRPGMTGPYDIRSWHGSD